MKCGTTELASCKTCGDIDSEGRLTCECEIANFDFDTQKKLSGTTLIKDAYLNQLKSAVLNWEIGNKDYWMICKSKGICFYEDT